MDKSTQQKGILAELQLDSYVFSKLNFGANLKYDTISKQKLYVKFNLAHSLILPSDSESLAVVVLNCVLFPDAEENNYPFSMDIEMMGKFKYSTKLFGTELERMLTENGIAIMFPYLRSAISSVTANAGVKPLIFPTINVVEYLKRAQDAGDAIGSTESGVEEVH